MQDAMCKSLRSQLARATMRLGWKSLVDVNNTRILVLQIHIELIDWMSSAQSNFTKIIASQISEKEEWGCLKSKIGIILDNWMLYMVMKYSNWALASVFHQFSWILPELRHRETTQRQEATKNVTCRVTQEGFDRLEWAQDTRWGESYCTCMLESWTPFLNWIFGGESRQFWCQDYTEVEELNRKLSKYASRG